MSSVGCTPLGLEPADVAALAYDDLVAADVLRVDYENWSASDLGAIEERHVEEELLARGSLREATAAHLLETLAGTFWLLRGIDRAFQLLHPARADDRACGRLLRLRTRWQTDGRLDTGRPGGMVLLKRCAPNRPQGVPDDLDGYLAGLVRVPPGAERGRHGRVVAVRRCPAIYDFDPSQRGDLVVACVAFIAALQELQTSRMAGPAGRDWYRIHLDPSLRWEERAEEVLIALDGAGVQLAILPELALDDLLLEAWQRLLRRRPPPEHSQLTWLLVGTGPVGGGEVPPNRAVMLHRITGEEVFHQDKCHPFTLASSHLHRWRLHGLGPGPLAEYMTEGRDRLLVESAVGRFSILVCEDFARPVEAAPEVAAYGVSHLLAPIFAEPIRRFRWEERSGDLLANALGAGAVVANSCAVSVDGGPDQGQTGTCLYVSSVEQWLSGEWQTEISLLDCGGDPVLPVSHVLPTA